MEFFLFLLFFGVIIFNAVKGKTKSPLQKNSSNLHPWETAAGGKVLKRANTARRAAQTGSATTAKYKRIREERRKAQMKANSGLWKSKHREDKNHARRTDWGARGSSALFSPQMIAVIGGAVLTIYLALTVLNA